MLLKYNYTECNYIIEKVSYKAKDANIVWKKFWILHYEYLKGNGLNEESITSGKLSIVGGYT